MSLTLATGRGHDMPTEPGYYLVYPRLSNRPLVLWASAQGGDWREGARRLDVVSWAGPLPEGARLG